MADLATHADLSARLGRSLSADEQARATVLLGDASAAVRAYTGQEFDQSVTTDRLRVRSGHVRLPQRPITAVASVDDVNGNEVSFTWDQGDRVEITTSVLNDWEIVPRTSPLTYVDVTYTHGYSSVPADIVAVVCQVAGRAFGRNPEQSGVTQVAVGDASQTFGSVSASGGVGMLPDERAVLDRYRRVGGSAQLARW